MSERRVLRAADWWLRGLLRFYPVDFREEHGDEIVAAYHDRCRKEYQAGGVVAVATVCTTALVDAMRNGPGERVRPAVRWRRSGNWGRDMELVLRRLVRAPLFVATMVGTLAIGLGAFAVVATVVHKVLIAPFPYDRQDDLYYVWRDYRALFDLERGWLGGPDVAEMQNAGGVIADAAGLHGGSRTLTTGPGVDPLEIGIVETTPNLFALLGAEPALGRVFDAGETGPGRAPLAVLTHGLWRQLGGGESIIGTEIRLNDQPYMVIGVMPKDFEFVMNSGLGGAHRPDLFITFTTPLGERPAGEGSYAGLIRARPGATPAAVADAVDGVGRIIDERHFESAGIRLYPVGLRDDLVAGVRPALVVIGMAGVFLVLVLMVNLATLLLSRAAQREKEFAVSRALGANRIAVVRATLLEGGALGVLGGALGALAAVWGTRAMIALAPADLPRRELIAMDWTIGGVVVLVGAVIGVIAATLPAVWAARADMTHLLSNAAVRGGGGHGRMRRGMVVVQVALSLVLLSTGGLVVRSFERLLRAAPGFDTENVLTLRVPVSEDRYPEFTDAEALHDRIHVALSAIPGVTTVSASSALPFSTDASQSRIAIPGAPGNTGEPDQDTPLIERMGVRTGYFAAMGARIAAGREFDPAYRPDALEAVVDTRLAAHFFPNDWTDALGATVAFDDRNFTIVGIVEHMRMYDVHEDGRPQFYMRSEDRGSHTLSWVIRSARPPAALMPEVRAAIHGVDRQLALAEVMPMTERVGRSLSQQRVSAVLIGGFAVGALLLAAMGLYGVIAAAVTRRRHELAVRIALGADHGRVLRLVLSDGGRLILLGCLIGVPGTWLASRAVRGVLVGVSATDPVTLVTVALSLGLVALIACYIPARRVLGIEPASSLRSESA